MTSPSVQAGLTDLSYTGQRDLGMGLMDYKARFYSPVLGRFTQPDTLIPGADNPQAWNRFSYVMNSPILYNDPSGHRPVEDKGGGCVVKAGCSGADERAEDEYFEEEYGTDDLEFIKKIHDAERAKKNLLTLIVVALLRNLGITIFLQVKRLYWQQMQFRY